MEPGLRPGDDATARFRGAGTGALLGASGALSAALRRAQHASGGAFERRANIPPAAAADDTAVPQAAYHHDSQIAAAQQGSDVAAVGVRQGPVSHRHWRGRARRPGFGETRHLLQRQGLLRSGGGAPRARYQGRGHHPHRATLSLPAQGIRRGDEALPERDPCGLVPGRAADPGRLAPDAALLRREHARGAEAAVRRAAVFGLSRGRILRQAPGTAEGAGRGGVGQVQGVGAIEVATSTADDAEYAEEEKNGSLLSSASSATSAVTSFL